jgi:hypothetical protein
MVLTESARLGALGCLCRVFWLTSIIGSRRADADAKVSTCGGRAVCAGFTWDSKEGIAIGSGKKVGGGGGGGEGEGRRAEQSSGHDLDIGQ